MLDCFQDLVEGMARGKLSSYNTKTFFVHDYHLWIQIDNTVCSGQRLVEYILIKCIISMIDNVWFLEETIPESRALFLFRECAIGTEICGRSDYSFKHGSSYIPLQTSIPFLFRSSTDSLIIVPAYSGVIPLEIGISLALLLNATPLNFSNSGATNKGTIFDAYCSGV